MEKIDMKICCLMINWNFAGDFDEHQRQELRGIVQ
jgi:hypothetical protein